MTYPIAPGYTVTQPVGPQNAALELRWADKSLASALPYTFDCTNWLADLSDSIVPSSVTITASPPTLTFSALQFNGTSLTWLISGGTLTNPVADYCITIEFGTVGGATLVANIWLRVFPLSPNKTFSTDLIVVEGPAGETGLPGGGLSGVFAVDSAGNTTLSSAAGQAVTLTAFSTAITAIESARALAAESSIDVTLGAHAATLTVHSTDITSLSTSLASEHSAMILAVSNETARAEAVESTLTNGVAAASAAASAETARAEAAESALAAGNNAANVFSNFASLSAPAQAAFVTLIASHPAFAGAFMAALPSTPGTLGSVWNSYGTVQQVT